MGADEKLRRAVSKDGVLASSVLMDQSGDRLLTSAAVIRDRHFGSVITYSPKVFIPLTQLCRDVCHYCTFAKTPSQLDALYVDADAVIQTAAAGGQAGCREVLLTLGEKPERRYKAARQWLADAGFETTVD